MTDAADRYAIVFKNGSAVFLARVVGADGAEIVQADISAITYSVYLLDDQDPDARTVITGHDGVACVVANTIFDTLQTDDTWECDAIGYNFRHVLDISANTAFAIAGRNYAVNFMLIPVLGQVILVRYRCHAI